uniref:Uncharacterized protein n=1 Tax=Kalanchoe fedtschenkoi TaxID=63787 RepID=A0A7N0TDT0_KALFE
MHRRLLFALFTLFCASELYLKQVCEAVDGRRELSSYWRDVMKDEDMPEAIQGLVLGDGQKMQETSFDREFQARPNLIIYHSGPDQVEPQDPKGLEQGGGMMEPGV